MPYNDVVRYQCFRGPYCFHLQGKSEVQIGAVGSFEALVDAASVAQCVALEVNPLNLRHENLKFHPAFCFRYMQIA